MGFMAQGDGRGWKQQEAEEEETREKRKTPCCGGLEACGA